MVNKSNERITSKKPLLKKLIKGLKKTGGRNNTGKITSFHKGGGHKRNYRLVKFNRSDTSIGIVMNIEYDPNRNIPIAAIYDFKSYDYYYISLPKNLKIGDIIKSNSTPLELKLGHSGQLKNIPIGSVIHNISLRFKQKAIFSRSAGSSSFLIDKKKNKALIKLKSGEKRLVALNCTATIGSLSDRILLNRRNKAGRSRWLNIRPTVRGVAMNPVDHPHGGGEGKTSGHSSKKSPWGKSTHYKSTRKHKNPLILQKN
jgi:large subunit ribosomal protein L2